MPTATLLITCPDQRGILAAVSGFVDHHNGSILRAGEHLEPDTNLYLLRVEWDLANFALPDDRIAVEFTPIADKFQMKWRLAFSARKKRVAIFVSKMAHCLADLLYRHQIGEIECELPIIVSNHPDARPLAEFHKVPYVELPLDSSMSKDNKAEVEARQLALMREHRIDLIILARYMQILTPRFIAAYPDGIINIHHSFLPAFIGARPHQRSYERGVKLIGATAHYVTEVLDEGPIIEQDVARVTHHDSLESLIGKGRDLERVVLSRAVRWHLEDRILVYGRKTVVFE
jgi:formyltetrahydrofolate deformylase